MAMSTTTWRIIQLIQSLPLREQQVVRNFLARADIPQRSEEPGPSAPSSNWEAEEGLPDDDPFFKIMEDVERERRTHQSRPIPDFA